MVTAAVVGVLASVTCGIGVGQSGSHPAIDLAAAVTVGGVVVSVLVAAIAALLVNRTTWAARQVSQATSELRAAADQVRHESTDLHMANHSLGVARDAATAQSQSKSEFLSTMSHEIRTPMNAVIGLTEIVLDGALDPEQREYLETIRRNGDTLLALINDILDWSKIEAGALELENTVFNVRDCVEDVVYVLAAEVGEKDLDLLVDLTPDCPPMAVGDLHRLRQVLVNLVGNAVKFTENGHVLVTVARDTAVRQNSASRPDGQLPQHRRLVGLRIDVADTGIGVADDKMDRLFRDFSQVETSTTRRYGGTGLGLAISQRLTHAMGGQITATSIAGRGSTFTATFLFELPDPGEVPAWAATPATLPGRRALVVDDNPVNRSILATQLAGWGMSSAQAESAEQAMALLRTDQDFDIGLFDFHMPGTDGLTLLDQVAALPARARLPVIMLTSMTDRGLVRSAAHPPARHLTKPVRSAALRDSLAEVLGEPAGRHSAPGGVLSRGLPGAARTQATDRTRVLVVEDNRVNLQVAKLMVEKLGYQVDDARNGQEAVAAAHRGLYAAILMDVQMPVMDGLEATRHLRHTPPPGPRLWIIALTASALVEDRDACTVAGMDDYLTKPVRRDRLADALSRVPRPTTPPSNTTPLATAVNGPKS